MIAATGIDLVKISEFTAKTARNPALLLRLFSPSELVIERRPESWAARFAVKESAVKALGGLPAAGSWRDIQVIGGQGQPLALALSGAVWLAARQRQLTAWSVSASHKEDWAVASVIAGAGAQTPVWQVQLASAEQTRRLGAALGAALSAGDIVLLRGELGAGKTMLTKGIAVGLGVESGVASPTFTLVREHLGGRAALNHVDAYRLEAGFEDLDLDLDSRVTVVEWPKDFLAAAQRFLEISIDFGAEPDSRIITLDARGWSDEQLAELTHRLAGYPEEVPDEQ